MVDTDINQCMFAKPLEEDRWLFGKIYSIHYVTKWKIYAVIFFVLLLQTCKQVTLKFSKIPVK